MSSLARFQGSHRRLVGHYNGGATVEVRTPHSLVNDNSGAKLTTLAVNGTIAAGAAVGSFDGASIRGTLPSGSKLTMGGTEYTTTAAVAAASNALASVPFTPVAVAEIANDATATITQAYGSATYPARRGQFRQEDVDGSNVQLDDWFLRVATTEAIPESADVVWDSETVSVIEVVPFKPGTDQASVRIHCRG